MFLLFAFEKKFLHDLFNKCRIRDKQTQLKNTLYSQATLSVCAYNFVCYVFVSMFSWFHGKMKREEAEQLLEPREDGLFLVRESNNYPGDYTLCVCSEGKVEHYHIIYKDNKLTIDEEEFFENLNQLVEVLKTQKAARTAHLPFEKSDTSCY